MPNWMPSLYPGGRARLIPRRTSFSASRRSAGSAARYSVTVDAGMGQIYHEGFCRGNRNVRMRGNAQIKETAQALSDWAHLFAALRSRIREPNVKMFRSDPIPPHAALYASHQF